MIEVHEHLFVGGANDYAAIRERTDWQIVQAARDPWHRQALKYEGNAAPREHPEYLVAKRGNRLILNLVDADEVRYFGPKPFEDAALFIAGSLKMGRRVLVHCNEGKSRAPSVAMFFLRGYTDKLPRHFSMAETEFKRLYRYYAPNTGIRDYLRGVWNEPLSRDHGPVRAAIARQFERKTARLP